MGSVTDEELPKALVLRLNSRMAVILNMLTACGAEYADRNSDSAALLATSLLRLRAEYPDDCRLLIAGLNNLIDAVPAEIIWSMGLQVATVGELRAWSKTE